MPGKPSRERRRLKKIKEIEDLRARGREYLEKGGEQTCRTCFSFSRCPVHGDEIMPCWCWRGF